MAQRKQLTWTELRVGLFVLITLLVIVIGVIYVTGTGTLAAKYRLKTYLPEVEGLNIGAPVRLDGVEIGNVEEIRLNPQPGDRTQNIEVKMRIVTKYQENIRADSTASLITEGLLGNRYVSIKRGFAGQPLQNDATLVGQEEAAIKAVVERGAELVQNLNTLSQTAREIVEAVQKGRGTLGKLLTDEEAYNRLNSALGDVQSITAATRRGEGSIGKLFVSDELYQRINTTTARMETIVGDVQSQKGSLGKLVYDPSLYDDAKSLVSRGNTMIGDVQAGKGTLGKLYTDETLFVNLRDAAKNVEAATAKLNSNTGTAGKLFTDPQLYDNLTGLTGDMRLLMGEFRQNPKKFLRVKMSIF